MKLSGAKEGLIKMLWAMILIAAVSFNLDSQVWAAGANGKLVNARAKVADAEVQTQVSDESKNLDELPKEIVVGPTGEYATISEAVNVAEEGDVIFVQNGVYEEAVKVYKDITIIGQSKDGVLLKYPCTKYKNPPLEAHCGTFKNLNIKAYADTNAPKGTKPYAVHCEKTISKAGSTITFEDCKFNSFGNWDAGVGSCDGFVATFINCNFSNQGMFYHTYGKKSKKAIESTLVLTNCVFNSKGMVTIRNCFAEKSVLNVFTDGTIFPTEGPLFVISSADATGGPIEDLDFMFGAKNINWN